MAMNEQVKLYDYEYVTKNRKLLIVEYDNEGKIEDVLDLGPEKLMNLYLNSTIHHFDFNMLRWCDRQRFSNPKKAEITRHLLFDFGFEAINDKTLFSIEDMYFKKYTLEQLDLAMCLFLKNQLRYNGGWDFSFEAADRVWLKRMEFDEILKWLSDSGLYYTVGNDGKDGTAYLSKPTKKQAEYQRKENGARMVYLDFKDFKKYAVSENELE